MGNWSIDVRGCAIRVNMGINNQQDARRASILAGFAIIMSYYCTSRAGLGANPKDTGLLALDRDSVYKTGKLSSRADLG